MTKSSAGIESVWTWDLTPEGDLVQGELGASLSRETRALDLLARPEIRYADLCKLPAVAPGVEDPKVAEQLEIQAGYSGYIKRQQAEIERQRANEAIELPQEFDYERVRGLSTEVKEKLIQSRPATLGQAGRIPGITPADVAVLAVWLEKVGRSEAGSLRDGEG